MLFLAAGRRAPGERNSVLDVLIVKASWLRQNMPTIPPADDLR
jgi:hypothetical protein